MQIEHYNRLESLLPEGPMMVDTHSYMLSPFGPAEQLHGGSKLISANSFWIRFALEDNCPEPFIKSS